MMNSKVYSNRCMPWINKINASSRDVIQSGPQMMSILSQWNSISYKMTLPWLALSKSGDR